QVPPEIVSQGLWSPINFPLSEDIKAEMVEEKNTARALAIRRTERAHINSLRPAMDRVRPRVICSREELGRFNGANDRWFPGIGFGIDDIDARGAKARDDKITSLDVRVWRVGAQRGTARIPAK